MIENATVEAEAVTVEVELEGHGPDGITLINSVEGGNTAEIPRSAKKAIAVAGLVTGGGGFVFVDHLADALPGDGNVALVEEMRDTDTPVQSRGEVDKSILGGESGDAEAVWLDVSDHERVETYLRSLEGVTVTFHERWA